MPDVDKIHMDMNSNLWEKTAGIKRTGAFSAKFHEEFHQLDAFLSTTRFGNTSTGKRREMTHPDTIAGQRLSAAIEKDVVNFFNTAINIKNSTSSVKTRGLKNTNRINQTQRDAVRSHIRSFSEQELAQLHILTDAIGLQTSNRVNLGMNGVWGHTAAYNKEKGKAGATSETWANFASYKFATDKEGQEILRKYMPNTLSACEKILKEVVGYVNENGMH